MKKITTRKLCLKRETVRNLDLAKVNGGAIATRNIICDTVNITLSNDGSCVLKCWTFGPGHGCGGGGTATG